MQVVWRPTAAATSESKKVNKPLCSKFGAFRVKPADCLLNEGGSLVKVCLVIVVLHNSLI